MADAGYARLHRSLIGHPAFRNEGETMAFAWMIMRASWKPVRVRYKGIPITLARGQLAISIRDFAVSHDRPKGWVERLFARLKNETMIETLTETGVTIITICKYDHYQAEQDTSRTSSETKEETATGQQQDTEQGIEEGKKISDVASATSQPRKRGVRLSEDWLPEKPYPQKVQDLSDLWPPGREDRELDGFRDYWTSRAKDAAKSDWNKAWHNRIRDQHDRIMRESGNGANRQFGGAGIKQPNGFASALRHVAGGET